MLNLRLLYILLDQRTLRTYLAILSSLGFGVLLDIIIFIQLSLLIGPWIMMAILATTSAIGTIIMYHFVEVRCARLLESVDSGEYFPDIFSRYISILISSGFVIVPGLFNTLLGVLLLIPPLGIRIGNAILRLTGIDWREAYEYLRLDRLTRDDTQS